MIPDRVLDASSSSSGPGDHAKMIIREVGSSTLLRAHQEAHLELGIDRDLLKDEEVALLAHRLAKRLRLAFVIEHCNRGLDPLRPAQHLDRELPVGRENKLDRLAAGLIKLDGFFEAALGKLQALSPRGRTGW